MITCHVRYVLDPGKLKEFEHYAKLWIPLVEELGGKHHGYFLPAEGADKIALCLFSFSSMERYNEYREVIRTHPGCQAAFAYAEQTRCIVSMERTFFRPVLG